MRQQYGKITGWGMYAPKNIVTNYDLEKTVTDTNHEWIVQRTGIEQRHVAGPDETTSTMSVAASQEALEMAGVTPTELDLILVATSSPDNLTPPVSSQIQDMLGATDVAAMTLTTGCSGFVYALATAHQFIETGAYQKILLIGVETITRNIDYTDRTTAVLFGDAAGAVVLEATELPSGLHGFVLGSDGSLGENIIVPAGGVAEPLSQEVLDNNRQYLRMNGREVFRFASRIVGKASQQALAKAGMGLDQIDCIIPHQANLRIIQAAARDMNIPIEKFIINVDKYANTSAASIPVALYEGLADGRIKPNDTVLMVSFGAGLTWAAAVFQLAPKLTEPTAVRAEAINTPVLNGRH